MRRADLLLAGYKAGPKGPRSFITFERSHDPLVGLAAEFVRKG